MNTSGEVADLMVKEGLMITEEVVKLTGLGAKNLAAIVIALLKEDNKLQGKTNLKKLLKSDKPLCIMQIKESDIGKFNSEAKKYGVLFTAVNDKSNDSGLCDIIAKQDDVTKLNYIMEKLGYSAVEPEIEPEPEPEKKEPENEPDKDAPDKQKDEHSKNPFPRAKENQRESESMKHGDTDKTENRTNGKPSVKQKVEDIKAEQNKQKAEKAPEKQKNNEHTQPSKKKKKKNRKKGKGR
ncbi:MAG: PcfB family protein [Clostridia bacterium]|nr:PcfB family protein [Clostridia bacterium]